MVNAINWILQKTLQVDGLKIQNYLYEMYFRLNSDSLQDKLKNYKAWILEAILTHEFVLYLLVNGYKESSVLCFPLVAFLVMSSSFGKWRFRAQRWT